MTEFNLREYYLTQRHLIKMMDDVNDLCYRNRAEHRSTDDVSKKSLLDAEHQKLNDQFFKLAGEFESNALNKIQFHSDLNDDELWNQIKEETKNAK